MIKDELHVGNLIMWYLMDSELWGADYDPHDLFPPLTVDSPEWSRKELVFDE